MSRHPTSAELLEYLPDDALDALMALCDVDPGEPEACIACGAYAEYTKRYKAECEHDWVDPSNQAVFAGDYRLCTKCYALQVPE